MYAATKVQAETRVLENYSKALIIRTNFYGWGTSYRKSFSDYIIESLRKKQLITLFDDVYYRMFIKEGRTDVIIHDWTKLDTTNENSFTLDTSIYVPREYFIELKGKTHTEEIYYDEHIKFEILSEK